MKKLQKFVEEGCVAQGDDKKKKRKWVKFLGRFEDVYKNEEGKWFVFTIVKSYGEPLPKNRQTMKVLSTDMQFKRKHIYSFEAYIEKNEKLGGLADGRLLQRPKEFVWIRSPNK